MVSRVATSILQQQSLTNINTVQADLAKLNKQISSGDKADSWDELNGVVERVSSYNTQISSIDNFVSNNTSIDTRLNLMDQSISSLQDLATKYSSLITSRRSASGTSINFTQQANELLQSIAQTLNVSSQGRYIFSGSKTDTAPITQPIPDNTTAGVPDANYYNGNSDILTAQISSDQQISYGVTANNPAFQQLIGAIKAGIAGDTAGDDNMLAKSVDLINQAVQSLASVRSSVDANSATIEATNQQQTTIKTYWQQSLQDDAGTDIATASIQLASDQTVLQATFQAFASLSKLKLSDYLN